MARRPAQPKRCALRLPIRIKITIKIKSRTSGPSHKRHIREPPLRRCGWGKTNRYFMPESPDSTDSTPLKELAADKTGALDPQDTVETAGDCMREHDTAQWPVAEGRKLVGMIDEKNPNPDWEMGGHGHDPKCWRVGSWASSAARRSPRGKRMKDEGTSSLQRVSSFDWRSRPPSPAGNSAQDDRFFAAARFPLFLAAGRVIRHVVVCASASMSAPGQRRSAPRKAS